MPPASSYVATIREVPSLPTSTNEQTGQRVSIRIDPAVDVHPQQQTTHKPSKWIRFGPIHAEEDDSELIKSLKDSAWEYIVKKHCTNENNCPLKNMQRRATIEVMEGYERSIAEKQRRATIENNYPFSTEVMEGCDSSIAEKQRRRATIENEYLLSINSIEKEAMDYYERSIEKLRRAPKDFRWMMVKDGCFFLQLTLHILGGGRALGYPEQHPCFGEKSESSLWIPAMFYEGNQIPLVVINALMKQQFFQYVMCEGTWERPSEDDLEKLALYQTVVEPQLAQPHSNILQKLYKNSLQKFYVALAVAERDKEAKRPSKSNILTALHFLLVGSGDPDPISNLRQFQYSETGENSKKIEIPSAGELNKKGIRLRKADRSGISNIKFNNCGFAAYLYLPPLTIHARTWDLLRNLVELELNLDINDREITSYIRFMRDLTRTNKDFEILKKKGIIQVDKDCKFSVCKLDEIISLSKSSFSSSKIMHIRHGIEDYGGPPWRLISVVLGILTAVQTIFTVLAYLFPRS